MSKNKKDAAVGNDKGSAIFKLVTLIFVTGGVFAVYRILMTFKYFEITLAVYLIALTAFIVTYIVYNRGMTRRNLTPEMLPDEWSYDKKIEFIEDGKRRSKKSSWMLMFIFAFIFTFAFDLLELYVLPWLDKLIP